MSGSPHMPFAPRLRIQPDALNALLGIGGKHMRRFDFETRDDIDGTETLFIAVQTESVEEAKRIDLLLHRIAEAARDDDTVVEEVSFTSLDWVYIEPYHTDLTPQALEQATRRLRENPEYSQDFGSYTLLEGLHALLTPSHQRSNDDDALLDHLFPAPLFMLTPEALNRTLGLDDNHSRFALEYRGKGGAAYPYIVLYASDAETARSTARELKALALLANVKQVFLVSGNTVIIDPYTTRLTETALETAIACDLEYSNSSSYTGYIREMLENRTPPAPGIRL